MNLLPFALSIFTFGDGTVGCLVDGAKIFQSVKEYMLWLRIHDGNQRYFLQHVRLILRSSTTVSKAVYDPKH